MNKADNNGNVWYYYLCIHGPGHQSTTEGYQEYPSTYSPRQVKEALVYDALSELSNVTYWFWRIPGPTQEWVDRRLTSAKTSIRHLKAKINQLNSTPTINTPVEDGLDDVVSEALQGRVLHDVVQKLHARKLYYTLEQVRQWKKNEGALRPERVQYHPPKHLRRRVLNAIGLSDSYPKYRK
jgi:hypothetical protein